MRLIDADKILETMKKQLDMQNPCLPIHLTEMAYRRYIDCPAESPCYVRYQTQYYERKRCLEIVEGGRKGEV